MTDALAAVNSVTAIITSEKPWHIAPTQTPEKKVMFSGRLISGVEIFIAGDKLSTIAGNGFQSQPHD